MYYFNYLNGTRNSSAYARNSSGSICTEQTSNRCFSLDVGFLSIHCLITITSLSTTASSIFRRTCCVVSRSNSSLDDFGTPVICARKAQLACHWHRQICRCMYVHLRKIALFIFRPNDDGPMSSPGCFFMKRAYRFL